MQQPRTHATQAGDSTVMTDRELLDLIDVEDMLNELGIRNVRNTYSGEVQFSCPFPGHSGMDMSPSATMSVEERPVPDAPGEFYPPTTFYCFTCGMRGTAIKFVQEYENVSPITAKKFLRERFAADYQAPPANETLNIVQKIFADAEKKPKSLNAHISPILDEEEVESRAIDWAAAYEAGWEPAKYMVDRGFTINTLEAYQIGFDTISSRISIPARNEDGKLVGFKGRAWWDDARPKYLALGGADYGFEPYEVSRILWGLHVARFVPEKGPMIIIEGELNALAMHQHLYNKTVGISGRRLSNIQVNLIKKYADSAIIYMDDQADAREAASKLWYDMPVWLVPPHDKDAADSTTEEVQDLISSVVPAIVS